MFLEMISQAGDGGATTPEWISAVAASLTVLFALGGLYAIKVALGQLKVNLAQQKIALDQQRLALVQLEEQRRAQRLESAPFVRIDIGPTTEHVPDFQPVAVQFRTSARVVDVDLANPGAPRLSISGWLYNLQGHELGVALGVSATFVARAFKPNGEEAGYFYTEPKIPYLQRGKAVRLELFRFPPTWTITAVLTRLTYYDLYDNPHVHEDGGGTNAAYGRLQCTYDGSQFQCLPDGWPRGKDIHYPKDDE